MTAQAQDGSLQAALFSRQQYKNDFIEGIQFIARNYSKTFY
ncbi:hypothetical protein VCEM1676A_000601 [Vibrio cholerae O1 str. EM-1676A]|nr:hypothetical protein VCEM1676A_000601 [Vibrio cholerae O1 str. EM-1676A]